MLHKDDLKNLIKEAIREEREKQNPTKEAPAEKPLSRKEAASFLKISLPTLAFWSKKGDIPFHRMNSRIYYLETELITALTQITHLKNKRR